MDLDNSLKTKRQPAWSLDNSSKIWDDHIINLDNSFENNETTNMIIGWLIQGMRWPCYKIRRLIENIRRLYHKIGWLIKIIKRPLLKLLINWSSHFRNWPAHFQKPNQPFVPKRNMNHLLKKSSLNNPSSIPLRDASD